MAKQLPQGIKNSTTISTVLVTVKGKYRAENNKYSQRYTLEERKEILYLMMYSTHLRERKPAAATIWIPFSNSQQGFLYILSEFIPNFR